MEVIMDEEIRNAMEVEVRKLMEEEEIRERRYKFVLHISPLEIITDNYNAADFISTVVVAENINQSIELVIQVIDHKSIQQHWSLRSSAAGAADVTTTTANSLCQHHECHHPRDEDDEEMVLTICEPSYNPHPVLFKIIMDQGVFTADASDDHIHHIMSTSGLLRDMDALFEYSILPTYKQLEELKTTIVRRICEAKAHVLREKPVRVRICVEISKVLKSYFGSAEAATFYAAKEAVTYAASQFAIPLTDYDEELFNYPVQPLDVHNIKPVSRLSREILPIKTIEKEDLLAGDQYSCPVCLKEFCVGFDIINKMPCSHIFHCTCLMVWFKARNTCPLCRYELPTWNCFQSRH